MKKLVFIMALALLAACRPDVKEIPAEEIEAKWVLNSRVDEFGGIWVSLSYSLPANYSRAGRNLSEQLESMMIPQAQVELEYQGSKYGFEEVAKGIYYRFGTDLQTGNIAQIVARDAGGKVKLRANCEVPDTVELLTNEVRGKRINSDTVFELDIRIRKPQAGNAWYVVSLGKTSDVHRLKSGSKPSLFQVLGDRSFLEKRAFLLQASDFTGDSIILHQRMPFANASDTLIVNIAQVDRPYFQYLDAVIRSSGWLQQLLGDAVNFDGNVEYGLGYFTLHQTKSKAFVLRKLIR